MSAHYTRPYTFANVEACTSTHVATLHTPARVEPCTRPRDCTRAHAGGAEVLHTSVPIHSYPEATQRQAIEPPRISTKPRRTTPRPSSCTPSTPPR